jgi:tyrosinase
LSPQKQQSYLQAVHQLKAAGIYDDFVWTHIVNDRWAHGLPEFLPWHRWFIYQFETELQKITNDCDMALPYWDWSQEDEVNDPAASPLLEAEAFGGFTGRHALEDTAVALNHQRQTGCNWPILSRRGTWEGCLERDFDTRYQFWGESQVLALIADYKQFGDEAFAAIVDQLEETGSGQGPGMHPDDPDNLWLDNITGFRIALEGGPHAAPHNFLGGVMPGMTSPNDPLFFVHHSNVDRIWALWQDYHGHSWLLEDETTDGIINTTDLSQYEGSSLDRPMPFAAPDVSVDFNWIGQVEDGRGEFPTPRHVLNNNDPNGIQVQYVHQGSQHVIPGHCPHPDWFRTASPQSSDNLPNMPLVTACQHDDGEQGRRHALGQSSLPDIVQEEHKPADLIQLSTDVSILYCKSEWNTFQGTKARDRWNQLCEELPITTTIPERLTWMALEDCEERGNPKSGSLPWIEKILGQLAEQKELVSQMELATECFHIPDDVIF